MASVTIPRSFFASASFKTMADLPGVVGGGTIMPCPNK
jgi:hypothetical protein